jgi:hypothetical protein
MPIIQATWVAAIELGAAAANRNRQTMIALSIHFVAVIWFSCLVALAGVLALRLD